MIEQLIENKNATAIYTDCSKSVDYKSVGCDPICLEHSTLPIISVNRNVSIFTDESIALLNALEYTLNLNKHKFLIFTDSVSSHL